MYTKITYFIKYGDGKTAWLSPDKSLDDFENITEKEERIMLYAEDGLVLKNKTTEKTTNGVWLKDATIEDYMEVEKGDDERYKAKRTRNK